MRIDRATFLGTTGALFACHGPAAAPAAPPQDLAVSPVDASVVAASTDAAPPPPPAASTARPAESPDAGAGAEDQPTPVQAAFAALLDAGACEEQRLDPGPHGPPSRPRRTEGTRKILDPLTSKCGPLEYTDVPASCDEGAFGCTAVVNTVTLEAGRRVLACLRARGRGSKCLRGQVQPCALEAFAATRRLPAVHALCEAVVDACGKAAHPLPLADCERYVSSMHKCHGLQRAAACLPDKCDLRACLDDWVANESY